MTPPQETPSVREHYREYRTVDKAGWGDGPWQAEPDKAQWIDAATGLDCLIVRNHSGALCGYVGVPEGHPWFGESYSDIDADVHGGLTFGSPCADHSREAWTQWGQMMRNRRGEATQYPQGDAARLFREAGAFIEDYAGWVRWMEAHAICHVPIAGRGEVFWLGFDCAHYQDYIPQRSFRLPLSLVGDRDEIYRDVAYVQAEIAQLAAQAAAATTQGDTTR